MFRHLLDEEFWVKFLQHCFVTGLPIGCSLFGSIKFRNFTNSACSAVNAAHGRSHEQLVQKQLNSRSQVFLQLLDEAFVPSYPWKSNLTKALAEVEGASTGLPKHFMKLP